MIVLPLWERENTSLRLDLAGLVNIDTARIGRMGELIVELELLARGWLVGNYNATTMNSAGWDLFATRGCRSVRIRVKAKRPGVDCFRWSAKADGTILIGLDRSAQDDFVAAVSFGAEGQHEVYILPAVLVEDELTGNHRTWLCGPKRGGGTRQDTTMRHLYVDKRADLGPAHGYEDRWSRWRGAWDTLDANAPPLLRGSPQSD